MTDSSCPACGAALTPESKEKAQTYVNSLEQQLARYRRIHRLYDEAEALLLDAREIEEPYGDG